MLPQIPTIQPQPRSEASNLIFVVCVAIIAILYMDNSRLRDWNKRLEDENRELRGGRVGLIRLIDDVRQLFMDNGIQLRK